MKALIDEIRRTTDSNVRSLVLAAAVNAAISARLESVYIRFSQTDSDDEPELSDICKDILENEEVPGTHRRALSRLFEILLSHGQGAMSLPAVRDKLPDDGKKELDDIVRLLLLFDDEEEDIGGEGETASMDEDEEEEDEDKDGFIQPDDADAKGLDDLTSIQAYVGDLAEFCQSVDQCKKDLHTIPLFRNNLEMTEAIRCIDGSVNSEPAIRHLRAAYESAQACSAHMQSAMQCFDALRREAASRNDLESEFDRLHAVIRLAKGEYDPSVSLQRSTKKP